MVQQVCFIAYTFEEYYIFTLPKTCYTMYIYYVTCQNGKLVIVRNSRPMFTMPFIVCLYQIRFKLFAHFVQFSFIFRESIDKIVCYTK